MANNLCVPLQPLHGLERGSAPDADDAGGPVGVLLGKVGAGDRLMLPWLTRRVHPACTSPPTIAWPNASSSGRPPPANESPCTQGYPPLVERAMADIALTDRPWPAPGTTVSVLDGALSPAPRRNADHPGTPGTIAARSRRHPDRTDRSGRGRRDGGRTHLPGGGGTVPRREPLRGSRIDQHDVRLRIRRPPIEPCPPVATHARRPPPVRRGNGAARRRCGRRAGPVPEATDLDPAMADAWLGRVAAGDDSLSALQELYAPAARGCTGRPTASARTCPRTSRRGPTWRSR